MAQTNRLNLSFIEPAQAQKHITVNEAFRQIDRMSQISVIARDVTVQPAAPQNGDAYILPANAQGDHWEGRASGGLAFYDEGWHITPPQDGFQIWVETEQVALVYSSGDWINLPVTTAHKLGVNTGPDDVNRLSVKSDAELLTHDDVTPGTGDARKLINKKSEANTASVLFQNDYQGKAELGLVGEDAFAIKTSVDGVTFSTALRVSEDDNQIDLFRPLNVNNSPVLSNADKPVFVANIADANTTYSDSDLIELSASMDSHSGFDSSKQAYVIPATGVYFVQIGAVIRSVSAGVTIVKLRAFKNGTQGLSVNAVNADANITTVNDSTVLQLETGDEISLKTSLNDTNGTVQFFPSSRLLIYRIL